MLGLILILLTALMSAYILKKQIEEVLPPFVMALLLGIYALIIVKKAHHAFLLSCVVFAGIAVLFLICLYRRSISLKGAGQSMFCLLKKKLTLSGIGETFIAHRGFVIFLLACVWVYWAYSTHFVLVWDDFHYNATFPKDCFYYGAVPTGTNLATHYKSYLPLLQAFFYWGFQGSRAFSEPAMFGYKMVLIYILLLPLFAKLNGRNNKVWIPASVIAVMMPFLFLFEVQESLSMDTVMAALMAYAIIQILKENKTIHIYIYIALALTCLTLMKTIAISFTAICLGLWFILIIARKGKMEWIGLIAAGVASLLGRMSWTVYCNRNGNTTYLTDILSDNMSGGIQFPDYAGSTFAAMCKSLVTMAVNLGPRGFSAFGMVIFAGLLIGYLVWKKQFHRDDVITTVILALGFIAYFALLVYTYLFVFEPWEADTLSSYDRYIGTYLFMVCYVLMMKWIPDSSVVAATESQSVKEGVLREQATSNQITKGQIILVCLAAAVLFATLPMKRLSSVLVPSKYPVYHQAEYDVRKEVEEEMRSFLMGKYAEGSMMIVNNDENTMYSRSMDYEVIPSVSMPFNTTNYSESEAEEELLNLANEYKFDYIYFTKHEREYEDISKYVLPEEYTEDLMEGLYVRRR